MRLAPSRRRAAGPRHESRAGLTLVAPTLAVLAVVIGYPVVRSVWMSFQSDAGLDPETGMFVEGGFAGLKNYAHWVLQQCVDAGGQAIACPPGNLGSQFWNATVVTVLFTVVMVALEAVLGLWMAVIMNRRFRGRGLVRAAVLVPWAIPTAVTAKLWYFIFAVGGIANAALGTDILWTSDEWASRFAVIVADTWKTTPFMALLLLAGLQLIPDEVYEAARVDGASAWQRFVSITLPLLRPALVVAVLFRVLDTLRIYDLPAILTGGGGGSGNATTTLSILVVDQVRQGFNSASALSTIVFLLVFAVAFVFIRVLGADITGAATTATTTKAADR